VIDRAGIFDSKRARHPAESIGRPPDVNCQELTP
jgi:hypothetical protein